MVFHEDSERLMAKHGVRGSFWVIFGVAAARFMCFFIGKQVSGEQKTKARARISLCGQAFHSDHVPPSERNAGRWLR